MRKSFLERYGEFASRDPEIVIGVVVIITIIMALSAASITIETDFTKTLPQDLPAVKNNDLIANVFSQSGSLFVLARLDTAAASPRDVRDIRDPLVMRRLLELETALRDVPGIEDVSGPPDALVAAFGSIPDDPEAIKQFFGDAQGIFGRDYSLATISVRVSGNPTDQKLVRITDAIYSEITDVGLPGSIEMTVTGGSIIGKVIFDLILSDLVNTVTIAGVLILITLAIAYRSPVRAFVSISVLALVVIWTGGTMHFMGIPLSIVTVMVGSMVVGVGIDYTIHVMNRYLEERKKRKDEEYHRCLEDGGNYSECLKTCFVCYGIAVDRVGRAIFGTAVTTIVSFLSLALSGVPFLADMGISLSIGIIYSALLSLLVLPALMSLEEKFDSKVRGL